MNIHKIQRQEHANFLQQNRQDPITGDLILDGDEIVFCKECKSAFLKDSWVYLGKSHCDTSETLIDFPIQKILELRILKYVNSLLFPIKGTENDTFEGYEGKLDIHFWRKIQVNLRIDSQVEEQISNGSSVSDFGKYIAYVIMTIVVLICVFLGIVVDFSEQGYIFLMAIASAVILLPLIFMEDYAVTSSSYEVSFLDTRKKILHFQGDGVLVYFDGSKNGYIADYRDITQIIFSYQNITIGTKNGHQKTFRLTEFSTEQIKGIIHFISQSSPETLLIFKNQPSIINNFLKNLDTDDNNIWIE